MAFVAVNDITPLDQYTATASQTDFVFSYVIYATTDIKVYVNDVLQTITTDYTVKKSDGSTITAADIADGLAGGKVVFNSGLTSGDAVSLSRDVPVERTVGYTESGKFSGGAVNLDANKFIAIAQQLERDKDRTLKQSDSDTASGPMVLPALSARALKYLGFDAGGNPTALSGTELTDTIDALKLGTAAAELTIATGAVTATKSVHQIDTESDAASDDLDTISGGAYGFILVIMPQDGARTVVAKDGTGNLKLNGDFSMSDADDRLVLLSDGTNWYELSRTTTTTGTGSFTDITATGDVTVGGDLSLGVPSELTIATGAVTVTKAFHSIDTERDAASDDLDTISGGTTGNVLVLAPENGARTVVVKDATGNIKLNGDCSLADSDDRLVLIYNGADWHELARTTSGGGAGSFTTLTTTGVYSQDDTTDSTSGTTGSIHTDGGLGAVKNIVGGADIYTRASSDYSGSSTISGFSSISTQLIYTKRVGNMVFIHYDIAGTSNSTSFSFTVPDTNIAQNVYETIGYTQDNGTVQSTPGRSRIDPSTTTVTLSKDMAGAAWTASGTKRAIGTLIYEAT